ncbi:MAG: hypothetical protein EPN93_08595 [Spirochaetes bacterium]|nr:MAG: hypothetical protein EPN93_08595 [Spirochaetota bacterium]
MEPLGIKDCRTLTREIAHGIAGPRFYTEHAPEVERARARAAGSGMVEMAAAAMREKGSALGHGFEHARSVAMDAGAIVYCEVTETGRADTLAERAIAAGYLHDIRRDQKDHPRLAAEFVTEFFRESLPGPDIEIITFAIRNHEAFKEQEISADADTMLLANALYDADKFRWGPDNFLYTIWDMAESMGFSPRTIFRHYHKGIEGIERIKHTFRTATGRAYGPDFIDRGLEIGRELYRLCGEK